MVSAQNLLTMRNADNSVHARMWRCATDVGAGESMIFRADRFELHFSNVDLRAEASQIFDYVNTHHNWGDSARMEVDGYTINWRTDYVDNVDPQRFIFYFVTVRRGAEVVLPETRL